MIGLMKDELGEKIMKEFLAIRPKTYSYLADDGNNDKKANGTNKHLIDTINIVYLMENQYCNYNRDLKVKHIICVLKKLIKLH